MNLQLHLQQLYDDYSDEIPDSLWLSELNRWERFIYWLLRSCSQLSGDDVQVALDELTALGLTSTELLSKLEVENPQNADEEPTVFRFVLKRHGFSVDEASKAIRLLSSIAKVVQQKFDGKLQRVLRQHGEELREQLVETFRGEVQSDNELGYVVSHWLQDTLNLPISVKSPGVMGFCERHGVKIEELYEAADEMMMNFALVDNLLELRGLQRLDVGVTES